MIRALVMVLSLSATPATAAAPLRFWHGLSGDAATWLAAAAVRFTAAGGAPVEVQADVDVEAALFRQEDAPVAPDVVLVASNLTGLERELGLSLVPEGELAGIEPRYGATVRRPGGARGVPLFVSDTVLLYRNRRMAPAPVASLEAILGGGAGIAWALPTPFFFVPLLTATGAWPVDTEAMRFASGPFAAATLLHRRLAAVSGQPKDCDQTCTSQRFYRGEAPYWAGLDSLRHEARARLGADLAVDTLPPLVPGGKPMAALFGTYALVFPNDSLHGPRGAELLRLTRHLLSATEQRQVFAVGGRVPVRHDVLLPLTRALTGDDAVVVTALATAIPMPNSRALAAFWPALRKALRADLESPLPDAGGTLSGLLTSYLARFQWDSPP